MFITGYLHGNSSLVANDCPLSVNNKCGVVYVPSVGITF